MKDKIKRIPKKVEIIFAENLKTIMKERSLTFEELSKITNVPRSSLNDYALCEVAISLDTAKKIADSLEVNFGWMIGESERRVKKIAR